MTLIETVRELDRLYLIAKSENTRAAWAVYIAAFEAARERFGLDLATPAQAA